MHVPRRIWPSHRSHQCCAAVTYPQGEYAALSLVSMCAPPHRAMYTYRALLVISSQLSSCDVRNFQQSVLHNPVLITWIDQAGAQVVGVGCTLIWNYFAAYCLVACSSPHLRVAIIVQSRSQGLVCETTCCPTMLWNSKYIFMYEASEHCWKTLVWESVHVPPVTVHWYNI